MKPFGRLCLTSSIASCVLLLAISTHSQPSIASVAKAGHRPANLLVQGSSANAAVSGDVMVWAPYGSCGLQYSGCQEGGAPLNLVNAATILNWTLYTPAKLAGCTTTPVISLLNGSTTLGTIALANGVQSYNASLNSTAVPASSSLQILVTTAGVGCTTNVNQATNNITYTMASSTGGTFSAQAPNTVLAGPATGSSAAVPAPRSLVAQDIPALAYDAAGAAATAQAASDPIGAAANAIAATIVTVKKYGAIADGSSHPACSALGLTTLAQLQAYNAGEYSFATACTNQLDWLATQKAVNLFASLGGTVTLPQGTMIWDQPLILPIGGSVTTNGGTPSIHLVGAGQGGTVIEPSVADFGAGSAMISCGSPRASYADNSNAGSGRYAVNGECYQNIENISLFNPYFTGTAIGTSSSYGPSGIVNVPEPVASSAPIQMDGFVIGGQTHLHRVSAWGFRMGLNVVGDHMTWDQADFQHNFCGVYFAAENKFNQGDIVMQGHFDVGANALAGICVDKDAFLNVQESGELYIGRNPYGILKFAGYADTYLGGSGSTYGTFIANSTFAGLVQSESVNNAAIWDDNMTNPSGGVRSVANGGAVINTRIKLYASNYAVSPLTAGGRGMYDWIGIEVANGLTVENQPNSMPYVNGLLAQIHVWSGGYQAGGIVLSEDFDNQLSAYGNANVELVTFLNPNDPAKRFVQLINPGKWSGGCADMYSGTVVTAGAVLGNNDYLTMQLNNGTQAVSGIAMEPFSVPSGGLGYKCVAYANQGSNVTVNASGLNNSTVNTPFIAASAGIGVSSATNGGYVIGTQVNGILSSTQTSANLTGLGSYISSSGVRSASNVAITGGSINGVSVGATSLSASGKATFTNLRSGVVANTDISGQLSLNSGNASYTFTGTYQSSPICTVSDTTAPAAVKVTTTATTLIVNGTGNDVVNYVCIGRN